MRKILIIGLLLGFIVITILGGYMIYHINELKIQAQNSINQMLENQNTLLKHAGYSLSFDPFKCDGFIFVECKNKEIKLLEQNGDLLVAFVDPILSVKNFDAKSVTLNYNSDFKYLKKRDLEPYFEILMPKKIKATIKISLETNESFFLNTHYEFGAENILYIFDVNQRIISQKLKQYGLLEYMKQISFDANVILQEAKLEVKSKDLSQALFKVFRESYGKGLDFASYQGLITLIVGLSMKQVSHLKNLQELMTGFVELVLGKRQKMIATFKPFNAFCLTCDPNKLENFMNQGHLKVDTLD